MCMEYCVSMWCLIRCCVLSNQTLCSLLDCLLTEDNTPPDSPRELYEIYFVFACVWAFGGALFQDHVCGDCLLEQLTFALLLFNIADNQMIQTVISYYDIMFSQHPLQLNDYRAEFSRWWSKEMRAVKFPSQGTVFDYFIDSETKKFTPWSEKMVPFELESDVPLQVFTNDVFDYNTLCSHTFL